MGITLKQIQKELQEIMNKYKNMTQNKMWKTMQTDTEITNFCEKYGLSLLYFNRSFDFRAENKDIHIPLFFYKCQYYGNTKIKDIVVHYNSYFDFNNYLIFENLDLDYAKKSLELDEVFESINYYKNEIQELERQKQQCEKDLQEATQAKIKLINELDAMCYNKKQTV